MLPSIEHRLAQELTTTEKQITAAIGLLDDGATVPFIARYRKEVTGGLSDTQLRLLSERLDYLRDLESRRETIIAAIETQGKMTPELLDAITHAENKVNLEDLYLPYRKKRRTKAQIAEEAGLQPLADALLTDPTLDPHETARNYLKEPFTTEQGDNPGVKDEQEALDGARAILVERFAEEASLIQQHRLYLQQHGVVTSAVVKDKQETGAKYADYFDYTEPFKSIPSHRALALLRGFHEKILSIALRLDSETERAKPDAPYNPCEAFIAQHFGITHQNRAADQWLKDTVRITWRAKSFPHLTTEFMSVLRERAEAEAINIFARNLKTLLLSAPAGPRVTLALDPGLRTGTKVAVVDKTGKVIDTTTVYPHAPQNEWDKTLDILTKLCTQHQIELIAIGNGTASRETDKLAKTLIKNNPELKLTSVLVSEAGASVYSASELASQELPDMDVSLRGAVSIARRLQDPLAELVKIDPKSIGVGQYQHDVTQSKLTESLNAVVEDCVNAVGVDVNIASPALLSRVSGINSKVAQNIVAYRDTNGQFMTRAALCKVPHLGDKAFEQAAGFLRIPNGSDPLDASAVHPESYPIVNEIIERCKIDIQALIGNNSVLESINPSEYANEQFGLPTIQDILKELSKPGRDPRPTFKTADFKEGVEDLKDLQPDMILEGVITNVAAFGAFVDIGVHQDGLVHISALANTFVKDPHTVVKVGQIVKVKVLEVDEKRKRISLTMRLDDQQSAADKKTRQADRPHQKQPRSERAKKKNNPPKVESAMAAAFAKLKS